MNFLIYTGKSYTMMGNDVSAQSLGIMPCAIAWLFRLIDEQKEKTGARFSVRVSAVEVSGKNEQLKDLLADVAKCKGTLLITCFCHFFFFFKDAIGWITSILVKFLYKCCYRFPKVFIFCVALFLRSQKLKTISTRRKLFTFFLITCCFCKAECMLRVAKVFFF